MAARSDAGSGGSAFVLTRVFDAPREQVWRAWTELDQLQKWWGPKGVAIDSSTLDLRPGGVFHYRMRPPAGGEMWGKFVYREIVPPERLVFVNSFSDAQGNTVRAPFNADWPLEVLSTLTFEEQNGKTTLTLRGVPLNANDAERAAFEGMFGSMQQGWGGTLDQLTDYMARSVNA